MKKRGMALMVTMFVLLLITASTLTLFYMSRDDMRIAGNLQRITKAKVAAASGIHHFQAMDVFYDDILRLGDGDDRVALIPETRLGNKTSYKVDISLCCDLGANRFLVISTGFYKTGDKVISSQVLKALMETR